MSYQDDFGSSNPNDSGFENVDFDAGGRRDEYNPAHDFAREPAREPERKPSREASREREVEPTRRRREDPAYPSSTAGYDRGDLDAELYKASAESSGYDGAAAGRQGRFDNSGDGYAGPSLAGVQDGRHQQTGYQDAGVYGSGNTSAGHYNAPGVAGADHGAVPNSKPSFGDKIKGNLEVLAGKITHDPTKVQHGEERKHGNPRDGPF